MNQLLEIIKTRRSVRNFMDRAVEDKKITDILDAAMSAPSAGNEQPWHFIVVEQKELLADMAANLSYGKMLNQTPTCIVVCGDLSKTKYSGDGQQYWVQDCSAATQNILLAAHALSLGAVWLGIHPLVDRENKLRQLLDIPNNIVPFSAVALGYPKEDQQKAVNRFDPKRIHKEKW